MDTTTPDGGGAQPEPLQPTEAVDEQSLEGNELVITTDEQGTPTLAPLTSTQPAPQAEEPAAEEPEKPEPEQPKPEEPAQAETDDEIVAWAEKKGLQINPENPNEVRLARMQLENDRKFHSPEQQQLRKPTPPPAELPTTGDENYDQLAEAVNQMQLKQHVENYFSAVNPEAQQFRGRMSEIANERPWITDLDALYALAKNDPRRDTELKKAGAQEALTNLAQKQSAIPPAAGATDTSSFATTAITPQNVHDLIEKNDQAWFEKNYDKIKTMI